MQIDDSLNIIGMYIIIVVLGPKSTRPFPHFATLYRYLPPYLDID